MSKINLQNRSKSNSIIVPELTTSEANVNRESFLNSSNKRQSFQLNAKRVSMSNNQDDYDNTVIE